MFQFLNSDNSNDLFTRCICFPPEIFDENNFSTRWIWFSPDVFDENNFSPDGFDENLFPTRWVWFPSDVFDEKFFFHQMDLMYLISIRWGQISLDFSFHLSLAKARDNKQLSTRSGRTVMTILVMVLMIMMMMMVIMVLMMVIMMLVFQFPNKLFRSFKAREQPGLFGFSSKTNFFSPKPFPDSHS